MLSVFKSLTRFSSRSTQIENISDFVWSLQLLLHWQPPVNSNNIIENYHGFNNTHTIYFKFRTADLRSSKNKWSNEKVTTAFSICLNMALTSLQLFYKFHFPNITERDMITWLDTTSGDWSSLTLAETVHCRFWVYIRIGIVCYRAPPTGQYDQHLIYLHLLSTEDLFRERSREDSRWISHGSFCVLSCVQLINKAVDLATDTQTRTWQIYLYYLLHIPPQAINGSINSQNLSLRK